MRRFEYVEGKSNKFWEVDVSGKDVSLRWGRIGTNGQTKKKSFSDAKKAAAERDELIAQKTKKGYVEVGAADTKDEKNVPKPGAAKKATPKKREKKAKQKAKQEAKQEAEDKTTAPAAKKPALPPDLLIPRVDTNPRDRTPRPPKKISKADRDQARKTARAIIDGTSTAAAAPLFEHIDDPELAVALVSIPKLSMSSVAHYVGGLLDALGPDAMAPLAVLWKRKYHYGYRICAAIACIRSPEAAAFFVANLDNREARETARKYLADVPEFALEALARSGKTLPRSILATLVRTHPDVVETVLPTLSDAPRAVIEKIRDEGRVDVPDALPEQLPPVFRNPPWKRETKKSAKPVVLPLRELPRDESIAWRAGQQQAWKTAGDWIPRQTSNGNKQAQGHFNVSERLVAKGKKGKMMLHTVLGAKDGVMVEVWNQTTAAHWDWIKLDHVKQLIARGDVATLPGLLAYADKNVAKGAELLARFDSTRTAPLIGRALGASSAKARRAARAWLDAFPETAATAFIPFALGDEKKAREAAVAALRYLSLKDETETVLAVAAQYGDEAKAAVDALLDWDPLDDLPKKLPKLPPWFDAAQLPRPLLKGREAALPLDAVEDLATMLSFSPVDPPYAGIEQTAAACDPESLFEFAWALFSVWLGADGTGKTDWAMMSLAHFGGDEAARRLTPLIRKWPGESQHGRAQRGLDLLAAVGSDIALMHLHGISQKLKYKALEGKALEKVEQIAEERGLTAHELADRLVPDLGLDERGAMELDFGPRSFIVTFDEHLVPFVKDADAKRLKALPKPGKSDDTENAKAATKRWKELKKDARAIAKGQILRMEIAMCSGRRWKLDVFENFFVGHPLMQHVVKRLVWGVYEPGGELTDTFRVSEDGTPADRKDDPYELADDATVGVPHPLDLDDDTLAAWGEVFGDYEILQPFAQLGRSVHRPTAAEKKAKKLERPRGKSIPTGKLRGLDARGWRKGSPQDAGGIYEMEKPVPGTAYQAVLEFEPGIFAGDASFEEETQTLGEVVIRRAGSWGTKDVLPVGDLSPVFFSELVADLVQLWD